MILTKEQISNKRNQYTNLNYSELKELESTDDFIDHIKNYDFFKRKQSPSVPGHYFLYENFIFSSSKEHSLKITHPKIGIYVNCYPCDQTIEVEWVDVRRTWEYNVEYEYTHQDKTYTQCVAEDRSEFQYLILWDDQMLIYGVWDTKPNWKQLRQAYEKTWRFKRGKDEIRDIQIDRILK